jgi:hypothetical protein
MKKIFILLATAFCLCMANKTIMAQVASGTTGTCTWMLTGTSLDYTLTISGNGVMGDYNENTTPWYSYNSDIKTLDIQQGVMSIGYYAFSGCSGLTSITIPNTVKVIGQGAFSECNSLISVSIPNSVTSIGHRAFSYCNSLTSVNIPDSVTILDSYIFYSCSGLISVSIPNSVFSIGERAFYDCSSLTSITIPNTLIFIRNYAFSGCSSLNSVNIPDSVTTIGEGAFSDCSGLTSISVDINNKAYSSTDGVLFNKAKTILICCPAGKTGSYSIPNTVISIEDGAFFNCSGLTSVSIPNSVTSIGDEAFYGCSGLTSVTIPNTVTSMGNSAFESCSGLTSVTISNSITTIGQKTFSECSSLTSAIIPHLVTSIGDYAFYGCSGLTSISIPNLITTIGDYAFYGCSGLIGSLVIPNSVSAIGDYAFYGCSSLTGSLSIPHSITAIGNSTFADCSSLTSVNIPNTVTAIGNYAFAGCGNLKKLTLADGTNMLSLYGISSTVRGIYYGSFYNCPIDTLYLGRNINVTFDYTHYRSVFGSSIKYATIPDTVTSIGTYAFFGCSDLTAVVLPANLTSIEDYAFADCGGLTSISIPYTVTVIGNNAFRNCNGLTEIYVKAINPPSVSNYTFLNISTTTPVYIPCGTITAYQNADYWNDFTNIIEELPFTVTVQSNDTTMGNATIIQANTCTNDTVIISATPNNGYRFVQWNDGNKQNPRTITLTQDITFTATFEAGTAITDIKASTISIYPNPARNNINITLPENVSQAVFTLYDMQGKVFIRKEISSQETVSVSNLATGIYIYNIITNKQKHTGKLIIKNE